MIARPRTMEEFLSHFTAYRANSPTDWHAVCRGHDDNARDPDKYSLHITLKGGREIWMHCFAGCSNEHVMGVIGLPMSALYLPEPGSAPEPTRAATPEPTPTLAAFAALKGLTASVLETCGWRNNDDGIAIPYQQRDGTLWRWRLRTSMRPGAGFKWDGQKERGLIPYGRHRLDGVVEKRELWVPEGESDAVTAWARGLPCLALPGNSTVKALTLEDLAGIETLWIVQEPGQSGIGFATKLQERLKELGYRGRAFLVRLPAKDLSDLHVLRRASFWDDLREAQRQARDLATWTPAQDAPAADSPAILGVGAGLFIAGTYPQPEPVVEGILTSDGPGWIAGEEKLLKTMYVLEEAVCIALGLPVCGRFAVPQRRRVLLIEEEDSPRRTHTRLRAILRGHGLDPDAEDVQRDLDTWLHVAVWQGFTFDSAAMVARLDATITAFQPLVVYLDVLRKITTKELVKAEQIGPVLATLDDFRRRLGCLFRVVHHYRKQQGFRTGRGSQEIGGSYVLGAWGENSAFFEPVGRKQGAVQVEIQSKDGAPVPGFRLTVESEGPWHAPTLLRLVAAEAPEQPDMDDVVLQAIATLDPSEAVAGRPGVPIATLVTALKRSDKTIRRAIKSLLKRDLIVEAGKMSKQQVLYAVNG